MDTGIALLSLLMRSVAAELSSTRGPCNPTRITSQPHIRLYITSPYYRLSLSFSFFSSHTFSIFEPYISLNQYTSVLVLATDHWVLRSCIEDRFPAHSFWHFEFDSLRVRIGMSLTVEETTTSDYCLMSEIRSPYINWKPKYFIWVIMTSGKLHIT
jgi:hypothetical protein